MFSTRLDNFLTFLSNLKLSSANSFSLEESKICHLVMGKDSSKGVIIGSDSVLEKKEMVITRIISFFHYVLQLFQRQFHHQHVV